MSLAGLVWIIQYQYVESLMCNIVSAVDMSDPLDGWVMYWKFILENRVSTVKNDDDEYRAFKLYLLVLFIFVCKKQFDTK